MCGTFTVCEENVPLVAVIKQNKKTFKYHCNHFLPQFNLKHPNAVLPRLFQIESSNVITCFHVKVKEIILA